MTLIKELEYELQINGIDLTNLSDFGTRGSINSARELKLLFESEKGALSERFHLGDEIDFRYGIGKINPINDFHGVCLGVDLNEYSLLCYDWLAKLIDEDAHIKKSKYLGWEKMSVIQNVINESDIVQRLFHKGNVLINENFDSDPSDWEETFRQIATYDGVNKDIDISVTDDPVIWIVARYSKSHIALNDHRNFEFEQEYEATNTGTTSVLLGDFRSLDYMGGAGGNNKNFVGVLINQNPLYYAAFISDSDGNLYANIPGPTIPLNTKYKYKCKYDKNSRKLTVERWEGSIYKDKSEAVIPSDKSFTVDDFGIGNWSAVGGPSVSTGNYDSVYLEQRNIRTDSLKGAYPQQYVTPYDDLKNSLKETRFDFIMKVLDTMHDLSDWLDIKLYEMWLRYDTLVIQKQRDLDTARPVMTVADANNLITTKPVIDKERMCNRCSIIDKDDEDVFFTYEDASSIEAYGVFYKNFDYKAYGQADKCQEIAIKYVSKHKLPTKIFGLACTDGYALQLGDVIEVSAERYGIKGNYRVTDIVVVAEELPSAEITLSDRQPDISEFL